MNKGLIAIAKSIDDGSYFEEATKWYFTKCIVIKSHFIALLFATFVMCIGLWYSYSQVMILIQHEDAAYLNVNAIDQTRYFSVVKSLYNPKENINISIARYFAELYVKNRVLNIKIDEDLASSEDKIKALSTRQIFAKYLRELDHQAEQAQTEGISSRKDEIIINKIEISEQSSRIPHEAKVFYTIIRKSHNNQTSRKNYMSHIMFNMSDNANYIDKPSAEMLFLVYYYKEYSLHS